MSSKSVILRMCLSVSQHISRKTDSFKCCWLAMLDFSPLSCCGLWSSPHHLPDIQHDTSPNTVSSPTGLFLTWCNVRTPTSGLPSKITKSILSLFNYKNLYQLSAVYRIVCTPQLVSEPLWHLAPNSSHSPRHHPPSHAPISSDSLLYPQYPWLSHRIFSSAEVLNQRLFCSVAMIGHVFLLSRMRAVILLAVSGSKPGVLLNIL